MRLQVGQHLSLSLSVGWWKLCSSTDPGRDSNAIEREAGQSSGPAVELCDLLSPTKTDALFGDQQQQQQQQQQQKPGCYTRLDSCHCAF